jgi:hypothetical protein
VLGDPACTEPGLTIRESKACRLQAQHDENWYTVIGVAPGKMAGSKSSGPQLKKQRRGIWAASEFQKC